MALEAGDGFISGLVATNPVGATDPKSQGDDHIRLIKTAVKGTFPNLDSAVTATPAQINGLAGTLVAANGSNLTNLNATALASGTVADARLSANVPLKDAANTFAAAQKISAGVANSLVIENSVNSVTGWMGTGSASLFLGTQTDHDVLFYAFNTHRGTIDSTTGNWELNGVVQTDFARLSQSNTFTGATQTVDGASGDGVIRATRTSGVQMDMRADNGIGTIGTASNHPVRIWVNQVTAYEISAAGAHDFKSGTVLAAQIANSDSETLVAGQLHFIDANATLPN
jgi:hypothetical protein